MKIEYKIENMKGNCYGRISTLAPTFKSSNLTTFYYLILWAIFFITQVSSQTRGFSRPLKGESPQTCLDLGLDCSETCCLGDECAEEITDDECTGYDTRPFYELYIGFGSLIALAVGVPLIIKVMNFLMLHKFCPRFDEMSQTHWGGYSICDCLTLLCPCFCFKRQDYEYEQANKEAEERRLKEIEEQRRMEE